MNQIWRKIPVLLKAILVGFCLLTGVLVSVIIELNLEIVLPAVPWSLPVVILILWIYWRFTTGQQTPFSASAKRGKLSKFRPVAPEDRTWTIIASIALFAMTCSLLVVGFSLDNFEGISMAKSIRRFNQLPAYMAILLFLGIALVAGIVEEIAFRGYMQTMMTEQYGLVFSFLFIAFLFAVVHGLPVLLLIPYMIISIGYSLLAQYSKSIIPAVITHVIVDFGFFLLAYSGLVRVNEIVMYNVFTDGISITFAAYLCLAIVSAAVAWFTCTKKMNDEASIQV